MTFEFIPANPPTLVSLLDQYRRWENRISPENDELWLNWIARERPHGEVVGHFQSGLKENGEAYIAYTVGVEFQRQGFAFESLKKICSFLEGQFKAVPIKAWLDTRNLPSIALVKKLGMKQIGLIENADHFQDRSYLLKRPTLRLSQTSSKSVSRLHTGARTSRAARAIKTSFCIRATFLSLRRG